MRGCAKAHTDKEKKYLAKKKKIGPYRKDEALRKTNRQKDLATLVRAGFDYDVACEVINTNIYEENI